MLDCAAAPRHRRYAHAASDTAPRAAAFSFYRGRVLPSPRTAFAALSAKNRPRGVAAEAQGGVGRRMVKNTWPFSRHLPNLARFARPLCNGQTAYASGMFKSGWR
jgi:hypothetical protein